MSANMPWVPRRVLRWALYDMASSNYIAIVPTFFGLYYFSIVGHGERSTNVYWGATAALSLLVSAMLAPLIGAYVDRTERWFAGLATMTAVCVLGTALLPAAAAAGLLASCAMFVVAQTAYTLASSIYDSLVVDIAPAGSRGRVSGIGWALGLAGGLLSIVTTLALVKGVAPAAQMARLGSAFLACGVLFGVLAVPGLAGVWGTRSSPMLDSAASAGSTLRTVTSTLRHWRSHREALRILLSFFLISDVLVTVQFFVAIVVASRFGVAVEGILRLQLMGTLIAVPATLFFGVLADRWGARRIIMVLCGGLALAILLLAFGPTAWAPTAAFVMLGLVYGSVQAVYRAFYATLIPGEKASELFGFNAIAGRLSAALGPLIFGAVAAASGNTVALCVLLIPLTLGVGLLARTRTRSSNVNATGEFRV